MLILTQVRDPVGFAGPTADALDDIWRPLPLLNGMSTASMTAVMTAWIVFGDSYHTASPTEEQGLGWHVRWISDVSSYIALF